METPGCYSSDYRIGLVRAEPASRLLRTAKLDSAGFQPRRRPVFLSDMRSAFSRMKRALRTIPDNFLTNPIASGRREQDPVAVVAVGEPEPAGGVIQCHASDVRGSGVCCGAEADPD